jgi:hypothetical protein
MTTQEIPTFLRFRIYLGHEIRPDKAKFPGESVDVARAAEIVADSYPNGFTMMSALGRWKGPDGRIVAEPSTVFEILAPNATGLESAQVRSLALTLRTEFRQDSVLVTAEPVPVVDFVA